MFVSEAGSGVAEAGSEVVSVVSVFSGSLLSKLH